MSPASPLFLGQSICKFSDKIDRHNVRLTSYVKRYAAGAKNNKAGNGCKVFGMKVYIMKNDRP